MLTHSFQCCPCEAPPLSPWPSLHHLFISLSLRLHPIPSPFPLITTLPPGTILSLPTPWHAHCPLIVLLWRHFGWYPVCLSPRDVKQRALSVALSTRRCGEVAPRTLDHWRNCRCFLWRAPVESFDYLSLSSRIAHPFLSSRVWREIGGLQVIVPGCSRQGEARKTLSTDVYNRIFFSGVVVVAFHNDYDTCPLILRSYQIETVSVRLKD